MISIISSVESMIGDLLVSCSEDRIPDYILHNFILDNLDRYLVIDSLISTSKNELGTMSTFKIMIYALTESNSDFCVITSEYDGREYLVLPNQTRIYYCNFSGKYRVVKYTSSHSSNNKCEIGYYTTIFSLLFSKLRDSEIGMNILYELVSSLHNSVRKFKLLYRESNLYTLITIMNSYYTSRAKVRLNSFYKVNRYSYNLYDKFKHSEYLSLCERINKRCVIIERVWSNVVKSLDYIPEILLETSDLDSTYISFLSLAIYGNNSKDIEIHTTRIGRNLSNLMSLVTRDIRTINIHREIIEKLYYNKYLYRDHITLYISYLYQLSVNNIGSIITNIVAHFIITKCDIILYTDFIVKLLSHHFDKVGINCELVVESQLKIEYICFSQKYLNLDEHELKYYRNYISNLILEKLIVKYQ